MQGNSNKWGNETTHTLSLKSTLVKKGRGKSMRTPTINCQSPWKYKRNSWFIQINDGGTYLYAHFLHPLLTEVDFRKTHYTYSALALVISKIKVGTTVIPIWSRPQFLIKIWSYMSGELRECSNFKNLFVKIYKNLGFLGQSGL